VTRHLRGNKKLMFLNDATYRNGILPDFPRTDLLNWQRTGDFSLRDRGHVATRREYLGFLFTSVVTSDVPYVSL